MATDRTNLPDVNVLLALVVADHPQHKTAMKWWRRGERFATAAVTENGLIRLLMNPAVMDGRPLDGRAALAHVASLRARERWVYWPDETTLLRNAAAVRGLLGARQVTDFHLLALAMDNHGVVLTFDAGFGSGLNNEERKYVKALSL